MQTQAAKVRLIPVDQVAPNPHNPRRLFDEEPMRILRESVEKLGILVPVTLYDAPAEHRRPPERFVLLDGERRWRCANELGLATVPAIIVERPNDTQNILTMFHIHNVREGWQLMPTALKLKTLIDTLEEENERKLSELTKLTVSQVRRCKILLTYPKRFQEMMLAPPTRRMKADFFIELDRIRRPALDDRFEPWIELGDAKSIEANLSKYENEVIAAVTDFRRLAEIYRAARGTTRQRRLVSEFRKFLSQPEMPIDDIEVPGASFAKESKEIHRSARRLLSQLEEAETEALASNPDLVETLTKLQKLLHARLEAGLLIGVTNADDSDPE